MSPTQKNCVNELSQKNFVYSESRTTNSLRRFAKQHAITLKSEAYSVGRLVNVIWGDDWDAEYFVDNSTKMSIGKLIHDIMTQIQKHE